MEIVNIRQAKTHLSRLINDVLAGGEVTIIDGRSGKELVKLVPTKPVVRPHRT